MNDNVYSFIQVVGKGTRSSILDKKAKCEKVSYEIPTVN